MNAYVLLISLLVLCLAVLATAKVPVERSRHSEPERRPSFERKDPE